MAYTTNTLSMLQGLVGGGYNLWLYTTTDAIATVSGSSYFDDAVAKGLGLGDIVWVIKTDGPTLYNCMVTAIGATAATVTDQATVTAASQTITTLTATTGNITALGIMPTLPVANPAAGGTAIGNATALTAGVNFVTGANDTAAVVLPTGGAGVVTVVMNTVANKQLPVFPHVGGTINALSGNASITMGNGTAAMFIGGNSTAWRTLPLVPS